MTSQILKGCCGLLTVISLTVTGQLFLYRLQRSLVLLTEGGALPQHRRQAVVNTVKIPDKNKNITLKQLINSINNPVML